MLVFRASAADLLTCRFALSPLWELIAAVRTTHRSAEQRWHLPWLASLAADELPAGLAVLQSMQPARGYTPDFLAPTPDSASTALPDEVERVARTPLDRLAQELRRCRADQSDPARLAVLDGLLADPAAARRQVVAALLACWDALLAAHWPRVLALLEADIGYRAGRLAAGGLAALLADLHPDVRRCDGELQVRWQVPAVVEAREVGGAGLVLMPSAFTWPHALGVVDPPWQPTLVYPARGVGALWQRQPAPAAALAGVLGPGRALLLAALDEPAATTRLAARCDMAASTVSRHLQLLQAAGLVRARRNRRQVLYERTALGAALLRPGPPQ